MTNSLDIDLATSRLHDLIVTARSTHPGISADPYGDALNLWVSGVPEVRDVLSTLPSHESTLGEVEFIYREAMTSWLRGDEPCSLLADDLATAALLADDELEHKIRMVLDPPAVWIF